MVDYISYQFIKIFIFVIMRYITIWDNGTNIQDSFIISEDCVDMICVMYGETEKEANERFDYAERHGVVDFYIMHLN